MLERNWLTFVKPFWKGILVEIFSPRWPSTGKNSIPVGVTTPINLGDWTFCADYTRLAKRLGFVKKLVPQQLWSFNFKTSSSKLKLRRTEIVQNCWTWVSKLSLCWSSAVINVFATRFALLKFALLRFQDSFLALNFSMFSFLTNALSQRPWTVVSGNMDALKIDVQIAFCISS